MAADSLVSSTFSSASGSASRLGEAPPRGASACFHDLNVLRVPGWADEQWLIHGFSTRLGGVSRLSERAPSRSDLNLGYTSWDAPEAVTGNRRRFLTAVAPGFQPPEWGLVTLKQMHSGLVRRVGRDEIADRASLWGDGLMTNEPGVVLGIQTADCLPVLIADRKHRAVAAFHAGWRGTLKGIVERGVESMRREFGSEPAEMLAAIGPGIGKCCFAVGDEVRSLFGARYGYAVDLFSMEGKLALDLVEANRRQLLAAGLAPGAIFSFNACTSCRTEEFFSYRAEKGKTGRLLAVIGIVP